MITPPICAVPLSTTGASRICAWGAASNSAKANARKGIAMVIERIAFQLSKYSVNSKEFFAQIKKLVTAGNIDRAIKLCDAGDYPTLQLVKAGLTHANKGPDEIEAAMSEKMGELRPAVEKRVGSLW